MKFHLQTHLEVLAAHQAHVDVDVATVLAAATALAAAAAAAAAAATAFKAYVGRTMPCHETHLKVLAADQADIDVDG
jgi:hypothetical protein